MYFDTCHLNPPKTAPRLASGGWIYCSGFFFFFENMAEVLHICFVQSPIQWEIKSNIYDLQYLMTKQKENSLYN